METPAEKARVPGEAAKTKAHTSGIVLTRLIASVISFIIEIVNTFNGGRANVIRATRSVTKN
jgi:hypothetical protein